MFRKIRQFTALPGAHRWLFVKISLLVPLVELGVKTAGFKRTFRLLEYFVKETENFEENVFLVINRHRNLAYLFSKNFPYLGKCLAHSLTLWMLLKNRGIDTDLRFGMKRDGQKLLAHAWLEYQGKPLATDAEIDENYSFFSDSILTKLVK